MNSFKVFFEKQTLDLKSIKDICDLYLKDHKNSTVFDFLKNFLSNNYNKVIKEIKPYIKNQKMNSDEICKIITKSKTFITFVKNL